MDLYFEAILKIILEELNKAKNELYKKMLIQALSMCCWNSTEKTLTLLEASGLTEATFKLIFNEVGKFDKQYATRRLLYGLSTLLEKFDILPPVILSYH